MLTGLWFGIQGSGCYWKGDTVELCNIIIIFVATVVVIMINIIMIVIKSLGHTVLICSSLN